MSITPLDIQQKRFRTTMRGFAPGDVDAFLNLVAAEFEKMNAERIRLAEDNERQQRMIDEYRDREAALKETMITAQRVTEEIKDSAKKEAEIIIGRAELDAERLLEQAQDRMTELLGEIAELKRQKVQFLEQLKGVIRSHEKLVELAETGDGIEENLTVMRRPA
jgi:cell division initiation protein